MDYVGNVDRFGGDFPPKRFEQQEEIVVTAYYPDTGGCRGGCGRLTGSSLELTDFMDLGEGQNGDGLPWLRKTGRRTIGRNTMSQLASLMDLTIVPSWTDL